jgi:hypothetical protein
VKFIEPIGIPAQDNQAARQATWAKPITKTPKTRWRAEYYRFTAIDHCTRLRVLRIYPIVIERPPSRSWTTCSIDQLTGADQPALQGREQSEQIGLLPRAGVQLNASRRSRNGLRI